MPPLRLRSGKKWNRARTPAVTRSPVLSVRRSAWQRIAAGVPRTAIRASGSGLIVATRPLAATPPTSNTRPPRHAPPRPAWPPTASHQRSALVNAARDGWSAEDQVVFGCVENWPYALHTGVDAIDAPPPFGRCRIAPRPRGSVRHWLLIRQFPARADLWLPGPSRLSLWSTTGPRCIDRGDRLAEQAEPVQRFALFRVNMADRLAVLFVRTTTHTPRHPTAATSSSCLTPEPRSLPPVP